MGLPGSGKGTCSYYVKKKFNNSLVVSVGDILREIANDVSNMTSIKKKIDNGELVDDFIIKKLIQEKIADLSNFYYILFDGFPRNLSQAEIFSNLVLEKRFVDEIDVKVVFLKIDPHVVINRLNNRVICKYCGFAYSKLNLIPDSCLSCNEQNFHSVRNDDLSQNLIDQRILLASENNDILLNFYLQKGYILYEIDASLKKEEINRKIDNILL